MLVAALVILAGVVVVASGRGGEMAYEHPDYPPLDLGPVTAADVALLRPPSAAWGYNMRVTDEALTIIARAMSERDVRISSLQQQVDDLRAELARTSAPWPGARHAVRAAARPGDTAACPPRPDEVRPDDVAPGGAAHHRGTQGEELPNGAADTDPGRGASGDGGPGGGPAEDAVPESAVPESAVPESAGPDDTVADGSIPAVTATGLPRQAPPAGYPVEAEPPGRRPAEPDLADFREVRPAERGDK